MKVVILPLAHRKMTQRGIPVVWIEETIAHPAQRVSGYGGRWVYQRRYQVAGRKEQLLRVVCEENPEQKTVITAYLSSDLKRYWRENAD